MFFFFNSNILSRSVETHVTVDLHLGLVLHAAGLLAVEEDLVIDEQLVPLQLHPRVGVVFPDLKPQTTRYQS